MKNQNWSWRAGAGVALASVLVCTLGACANKNRLMTGKSAMGDWRSDAPGVRRKLTLSDQPKPGKSTQAEVHLVARPSNATLKVPEGFRAEMVETGFKQPRVIRRAPNGDMFIADSKAGQIRVLRMTAGSTKPEASRVFASGLSRPYGIAFYPPGATPQWMYVGVDDGVVRIPYSNGELAASGAPERIIERIPWAHHWTRDTAFSVDGSKLYLAVGSGSNVAQDMFPEPKEDGGLEAWKRNRALGEAWDTEEYRAMILSYNPDGTGQKVYATGLRNPAGITVRPSTGDLWAVINERDELGDDTPFEYATRVQEGKFYGWPWYYAGPTEDPRHQGKRPDLRDRVTNPDVYMQAHSAALQIAFYDGVSFPESYHDSAFVTLHGSWNREQRTGYKVVRLKFNPNGTPTGEYEDFITGFVLPNGNVWGRPVGVAVGPDGSLLITEDGSGSVWRVSYVGGETREGNRTR
jgi:glucose/arabinose dehydrogenase